MTREEITKIRDAASDLNKIAERFEKASKPDNVIGNAIDHLYAMAASYEARILLSETDARLRRAEQS